jgi:hypothetical protein
LEFGFGIEFGHGLVVAGEEEEGVIAEASGASGSGEDFTFDGAVGDAEDFAIASCGEDAMVAGFGVLDVEFSEGLLEAEVVTLVSCGGWGDSEVFVFGVAGGADAGCSVEDVDFEAGVVGEDDFSGRELGVVDGLEAGVAFEGWFVFGGWGNFTEAREGFDGDVRGRGGCEVAELAGVGGGDVEGHGFVGCV